MKITQRLYSLLMFTLAMVLSQELLCMGEKTQGLWHQNFLRNTVIPNNLKLPLLVDLDNEMKEKLIFLLKDSLTRALYNIDEENDCE
jgi:hypothetical protein